jgi:hypothetical protein
MKESDKVTAGAIRAMLEKGIRTKKDHEPLGRARFYLALYFLTSCR